MQSKNFDETTDPKALLREALKRKGIGPKGSKKLPPDLLQAILPLLADTRTNRTTAAAFWTACLLLENSEEEQSLLDPLLQNPQNKLLPELQALMSGATETFPYPLLDWTRQVIHKQELSIAEARQAVSLLWDNTVPEWVKGAFLQAERIKREGFEENLAFLESMWNTSYRLEVDLPCLIELADSYDGTSRSYHFSVFVAAVLAAMGFPTLVHGAESLAPKYGITSSQVLKEAGLPAGLSLKEVQATLENAEIGWGYVEESVFFPQLRVMKDLRHDMVKRPFLATFEKLLSPIQNRAGNHLFTGYVHAHYREELVKVLSVHNQYRMFFNLRSIEGSTNCWLKKPTPYMGYSVPTQIPIGQPISLADLASVRNESAQFFEVQQKTCYEGELVPSQFGLHREDHELLKEITVEQTVQEGLSALRGSQNLAQEILIYHAACFAWLGKLIPSEQEAASRARQAIVSGSAWTRWQNYGNFLK